MKGHKCAAAELSAQELLGFASGSRSVHAKVGEKPKAEPPDGFFDPPDDDDEPEENGAGVAG